MPVPFYLQRPEEENPIDYTARNYNSFENPNKFNNSYLVAKNSFDRGVAAERFNEFFETNMQRIRNSQPTPKNNPSSWKENINYDNGYDANVEDRFRAEHDYLGLADYLSRFKMDNVMDQRSYENEISQLRRYGRQYNAMHANASQDQSFALAFDEAFNSGNIDGLDDSNPLKKQYYAAMSNLGRRGQYLFADYQADDYRTNDPNSPEASSITVSFNNKKTNYFLGFDFLSKDDEAENQFDLFARQTGYDAGEIKSILGDNAISIKEGRVIVNVPKSNIAGIKLLSDIRNWCNETGRNTDDVSYASYDANNQLITDDTTYIGSQIQDISNLLANTDRSKEEVMSTIGAGEQIVSTTILPYMNEHQMQLKGLLDRGMITAETYNAQLKADNATYENLLLGTAFSQLDIYTDMGNEAGDETLYQMKDNIERGKLKDYIRNAISKDRVSWRAGISGGEYGTYLVVTPERDKGDVTWDEDDARRGMTIFIPGLFTKSIQNAFDASTQGKTVAEINSMQQYGYEYTLANGNVISNVGNSGAKLYDKNTDSYRNITREEAHDLLHQSIIVEDASQNIRNRMFNLDGSLREGYNYEADAKKIAIAAANEVYSGLPVEESDVWYKSATDKAQKEKEGNVMKDYKRQQALEIYSEIMNNIYKLINVSK